MREQTAGVENALSAPLNQLPMYLATSADLMLALTSKKNVLRQRIKVKVNVDGDTHMFREAITNG